MDKPVSLSVKHYIIRNMSVKMMVQERIIETVVNHQFDSAYEALNNCESLEFSGFGKFFFNRKKALKKISMYENHLNFFNEQLSTEVSPIKKRNLEMKIESTKKNLEHLKKKLKI